MNLEKSENLLITFSNNMAIKRFKMSHIMVIIAFVSMCAGLYSAYYQGNNEPSPIPPSSSNKVSAVAAIPNKRLVILVSPLENQTGIRKEIVIDRQDPNKIKRIKYTVDQYTEAPRALLENILSGKKNVTLIERQRLDKILLEIGYNIRSGYIDSKYLIKIGKQLGANTIAFGTLVSINDKVSKFKGYGIETERKIITASIRFRLVDIKSSEIIFSTIAKGQSVVDTSQYSSISDKDGKYEAIEDAINHLSSDRGFQNYLNGNAQ